ncbi:HWE histidine kinase domain-containing protein [Methylocystis hirsuta]|uniref:Blue-light-activated histidine kinase n=1 Tax=Methylocystis hirsuta TaxID=369798 RepID=A0A3M9XMP7_9HYPH|nr:HWE histidine kinase domain-containing protein [Methylocystis hirsuta]RNJ49105.1 PAS domain-containing protein [Methylocystis hirsuta]
MSSETDISAYSRSILETVGLPLLALDPRLTVEVANKAFLSQFQATREETIGRPVYEIGDGQWNIPELRRLLEQIVERDSTIEDYRVEHVFEGVGRRILRLNAKRIRRPDEKECILLAISDESECDRLRHDLEGRMEFSEKLIDSVREALLILHCDLTVHSANPPFYRLFGGEPKETEGRPIYELGDGQWDTPELRRLLEDILPRRQSFDDYQIEHVFQGFGPRVMLLNGRRLDHLNLILLAIRDTMELRTCEVNRRDREARQNLLVDLNDRLRTLADPAAIQAAASELLGRHLDASQAAYAEIDEAGDYTTVQHDWNDGAAPSNPERHRLVSWGEALIADLKRGRTIAVSDVRNDLRTAAHETLRSFESHSVSAFLAVPLVKDDRLAAVVTVHSRLPRTWSAAQAAVAEDVAERTWSAIERARAEEALRDSESRYRLLFESIDESFTVVEPLYDEQGHAVDYRFLEVNPAFEAITGLRNVERRTGRELVPSLEKDWIDTIGRVAASGNAERVVRRARALGKIYDAFVFRIGEAESPRVAVLSRDVTERVRAEEQRALLMRELNHRSKNMLSIVLAIARATAGNPGRDFEETFQERILSLAANQDLLVASDWQGVTLSDLVRSQLAHLEDLIDDRIALNGPPLIISAAASQSFSMALHELATNAVKYGALSNSDGRVDIEWGVRERDGEGRRFTMRWRETEGPAVVPPARNGFGSTVIRDMIRLNLRGDARLQYDSAGVVWDFECPIENVLEAPESLRAEK